MSLGGPAADVAGQVALNVLALLEYSPPEGWDRGTDTVVACPTVVSTALAGLTVATLRLLSFSACCDIAPPCGLASRSSSTWRLALWEGSKVAGRLVEAGLQVEVLVASAAQALLLLVP